MGSFNCCNQRGYYVDDIHENFYRDIIYSYQQNLRETKTMNEFISNSKNTDTGNSIEDEYFTEERYLQNRKNLFPKDSEYLSFYMSLFPNWSMAHNYIFPDLNSNLYIHWLSLISDANKSKMVMLILEKLNQTPSLYNLLNLLEEYLQENLEGFTGRILKVCIPCKEQPVMLNHIILNRDFVENLESVSKMFHQSEAKSALLSEISGIITKEISDRQKNRKENQKESKEGSIEIDETLIDKVINKLPFLFNAMELRHAYYLKLSNENQDSKY